MSSGGALAGRDAEVAALQAAFEEALAEQAALRRVATLVAQAARPEQVFAAVAEEAGRLLVADFALLVRYDDLQEAITIVGTWTSTGAPAPTPVGGQLPLGGQNVITLVYRTGQPARTDYADVSGVIGQVATDDWGLRSSVGVPISIEGRLWGVMVVAFTHEKLLPADTEARLTGFTDLVATAIANAQARGEARGFEEQAALRRVATLVARAVPPEEVFAAITAEAGRLLTADVAILTRYDPDSTEITLGVWARAGAPPFAVGSRAALGGRDVSSLVFQTSRSARIERYAEATGPIADIAREGGLRAAAGVPISVAGQLWGVMIVGFTDEEALPADAEARLAGFTELAATTIANAQAQAELAASRARIVAVGDAARRRIQRNLHDGAQQRLVILSLVLEEAQAAVPPGADELAQRLEGAVVEVAGVLEELKEIARGLHPAALTDSGLRPALRALIRRSGVPVSLDIQVKGRLPEPVEVAAYYAVAEALTNIAKYADASAAEVEATAGEGVLQVWVRDDGRGGADFGRGSGLAGLKDRIEALGGRISLHSPPGAGTTLQIALPLDGPSRPAWES